MTQRADVDDDPERNYLLGLVISDRIPRSMKNETAATRCVALEHSIALSYAHFHCLHSLQVATHEDFTGLKFMC